MTEGGNPFDAFPRLYDWEHDPFEDDLVFYQAIARKYGGPVLELACGSGRLLAPLARAGFRCTGVDSSPAMLDRARRKLAGLEPPVRLIEQPMESLHLDGRFRTILLALDSLGLLTHREEQLAALRAARVHAVYDGRLVVDVSNGNLRGGNEPADELFHHLTEPDPVNGRPITKWVARRSDPALQLDDLLTFYDEIDDEGRVRRTTVSFRLRWFTRYELELLLERAGWSVEEVYGGYDFEPFGPASERIILVARRAETVGG